MMWAYLLMKKSVPGLALPAAVEGASRPSAWSLHS
jgi:hypothetical protein